MKNLLEQSKFQSLSCDQKILNWKEKNIQNFDVDLSFGDIHEKERTKHVHRLHPYLGKFISQDVKPFHEKLKWNIRRIIECF